MIYKTWTDAENDGAIWCLPVFEIDNGEQIYCTTLPEAIKEFNKIEHGYLIAIALEYSEPTNKMILSFK